MAGFLKNGVAWLKEQTFSHLADEAVGSFTDGTYTSSIKLVSGGPYLFRVDQGEGVSTVKWSDQDFIVQASELKLNGVAVLPAAGQQFTRTVNGKTEVFELMYLPSEQPWKWHDPDHTTIRLHCKRVSELSA